MCILGKSWCLGEVSRALGPGGRDLVLSRLCSARAGRFSPFAAMATGPWMTSSSTAPARASGSVWRSSESPCPRRALLSQLPNGAPPSFPPGPPRTARGPCRKLVLDSQAGRRASPVARMNFSATLMNDVHVWCIGGSQGNDIVEEASLRHRRLACVCVCVFTRRMALLSAAVAGPGLRLGDQGVVGPADQARLEPAAQEVGRRTGRHRFRWSCSSLECSPDAGRATLPAWTLRTATAS